MRLTRRGLLSAAGAAGAVGLVGLPRARAAAWDTAGIALDTADCPGGQRWKVLEIFLEGGLSHLETIWIPTSAIGGDFGVADYSAFDASLVHDANTELYSGGPYLGAMCDPVVGENIRLVALGHELAPHPAATHLTLTGQTLGRATAAGCAAAVQRAAEDSMAAFVISGRGGPRTVAGAASVGLHGSEWAPIVLSLANGQGSSFQTQLTETRTIERNHVLAELDAAYASALTPGGDPSAADAVRSAAYEAYTTARQQMADPVSISGAVGSLPLTPDSLDMSNAAAVAAYYADDNPTALAIEAAATLLADSAMDVRHVCVIDGGAVEGYDRHTGQADDIHHNATIQAGNLWNVCNAIATHVNLTDTLVVLSTEFGRVFDDDEGTTHAPEAYAVALIGGPIGSSSSSGDVEDASSTVSPAELRAAVLLALGVNPFHAECLADDLDFDPTDIPTACADLSAIFFGV
ncbi:MAG: hypothetical protein ACI8PZ_000478 [Myxococcota bacterium]